MQYGKLCSDPERTAYYKLKLNEIFGDKNYVDTDSVKVDSETKFVKCIDCKYHMFSDFELECGKGYKGIVNRDDGCDKGERK
jgi:hypothetical protein